MKVADGAGVAFLFFDQVVFCGSRRDSAEAFRTDRIDRSVFVSTTRETGHRAALSRTKYGHFLDVPRADSGSELDTLLRT